MNNVDKLIMYATLFAYSTNTKDANYPGGKPKPEYKDAFMSVFSADERNSWKYKAHKDGANCGAFIGTVVRASGIDPNFAHTAQGAMTSFKDTTKWISIEPDIKNLKNGDIIDYKTTNGGYHICMYYNNTILEASYNQFYPKTTNSVKTRISKSNKDIIKVYRVKEMTNNEKARNAAVEWAVAIAKDNNFHYGETKWAHHSGCYFCGTNGKNSAKVKAGAKYEDQLKTYCCNPFVTAAYHHGAGAPSIDCKVASKRINLANDKNKPLQDTKEWKKITKPSKITSLLPGDILLTPTHCMLYAGDGKIVHAAGHDDGKKNSTSWNKSIRVEKCPSAKWSATTKIYRYIGNGKFGGASMYEVGTTYVLLEDMNIRGGAGSDYDLVPVSKWTTGAQALATKDGMLAKGTRVTCKEVKTLTNGAVWIKIPSGWMCAIGSTGKVFIEKAPVKEETKPEVKEEPVIEIVEEPIEEITEEPVVETTEPEPVVEDVENEEPEINKPVVEDFKPVSNGLFNIKNFTDKNSVVRMLASAIASLNLIIVAFGGEMINVADSTLYLIASVVAFVVTGAVAVYKNNATSKFGMLCKKIKVFVNKYGIEDVFNTIMDALYANFGEPSDEDPDENEVLPQ